MGGFNKYLILDFFSFNAVASVDYIYLRVGRVRPGGGGGAGWTGFKAYLFIFCQGAMRGLKTNLNKKKGGQGKL